MDDEYGTLVTGEAVKVEGTFPGIFIEHIPREEYDHERYSVVLCVLPSKMFSGRGETWSGCSAMQDGEWEWNEMLAHLWESMRHIRPEPAQLSRAEMLELKEYPSVE